jgi:long-chain acyl-CoA synthetase
VSVHWPIIRRILSNPRRIAMIDDRRAYKAVELLAASFYLASHLQSRCTTKTLGVLVPTSGAAPIAMLAGWILGKTVVPLNFLLKREELQYVVEHCETDTILTVQPLLDFMGYTPAVKNVLRFEDVPFSGVPDPILPAFPADDELALLLYTSGTSGRPKGVMLTHGNISANIRQVQDWAHFTSADTMLGVLPQFHSFGLTVLTLLPLTFGIRVVYAARFVPNAIIKLMREHRPTIFVAIPSMYNALLSVKDAGPDDLRSLRYAVSGGEPLPDATFSRFRERFNITLNEGFGMTETSPVTNWCRPDEWRAHSVGKTLPRILQRIADPATNRELPLGTDGELQMRGPNITQGYFKNPDDTAKLFTPDGWLKSGDMARFDAEGHLYITGRIKEMLIIGGENVFPREIEEVLNRHPSIKESGVVGRPDPMRGEVPIAFIETREGESFDEPALKRFCRESLAGYKVPDTIIRLDALPRNPTGKILRRELKKLIPQD